MHPEDACVLRNIQIKSGPMVTQPDGTEMRTYSSGDLPLHHNISAQAKREQTLSTLCSASLIALGPLCNDGSTVVITKKDPVAINDNKVVLQGQINRQDDLWDIPLQANKQCQENCTIPLTHPAIYPPPNKKSGHPIQSKQETPKKY